MNSHVASMGLDSFREFVDEVYNIDEGQVFRKREKLDRAFMSGYGSDYAPNSIWSGINAILPSLRNQHSWHYSCRLRVGAQFARGVFGAGCTISARKQLQAISLNNLLATFDIKYIAGY